MHETCPICRKSAYHIEEGPFYYLKIPVKFLPENSKTDYYFYKNGQKIYPKDLDENELIQVRICKKCWTRLQKQQSNTMLTPSDSEERFCQRCHERKDEPKLGVKISLPQEQANMAKVGRHYEITEFPLRPVCDDCAEEIYEIILKISQE